jgi:large subunit ribosomal protein L31
LYNQFLKIKRGIIEMKEGIHPDHKKTTISCVCGNVIETGSVKDNIRVEICSNCHPFFTGTQKILDSEGRVERFNKRYGKAKTEEK